MDDTARSAALTAAQLSYDSSLRHSYPRLSSHSAAARAGCTHSARLSLWEVHQRQPQSTRASAASIHHNPRRSHCGALVVRGAWGVPPCAAARSRAVGTGARTFRTTTAQPPRSLLKTRADGYTVSTTTAAAQVADDGALAQPDSSPPNCDSSPPNCDSSPPNCDSLPSSCDSSPSKDGARAQGSAAANDAEREGAARRLQARPPPQSEEGGLPAT